MKRSERIAKVKSFVNKCKWKRINFPQEKDDWKKFEENNQTIALNVLYAKKERKYPAYVSKNNSNREKQVLLLMILNGEGRHYLAVKKAISIIEKEQRLNITVIFIV